MDTLSRAAIRWYLDVHIVTYWVILLIAVALVIAIYARGVAWL